MTGVNPGKINIMIKYFDFQAVHNGIIEELTAASTRVIKNGRYILGEELEQFESRFAAYCGVNYCLGVGNGLDALYLILKAYGIGPGDEVIVPAHTFIATWLAVTRTGAKVVPVEPELCSYNIDPARIADHITVRTRAIIVVHLYGLCADMEPITRLGSEHGVKVIEDAAQAHGATYAGCRTGNLADAAAFSFYPTKILGCLGDGGAVCINDEELATSLGMLRNYGSRHKYSSEQFGLNSRLDELQAAFLNVKLTHIDDVIESGRSHARAYREQLDDLPELTLPSADHDDRHVYHQIVCRVEKGSRNALVENLKKQDITVMIHYPEPPHLSGAYARNFEKDAQLPLTESICNSVISFPNYLGLSRSDLDATAAAIRRYFHHGL